MESIFIPMFFSPLTNATKVRLCRFRGHTLWRTLNRGTGVQKGGHTQK